MTRPDIQTRWRTITANGLTRWRLCHFELAPLSDFTSWRSPRSRSLEILDVDVRQFRRRREICRCCCCYSWLLWLLLLSLLSFLSFSPFLLFWVPGVFTIGYLPIAHFFEDKCPSRNAHHGFIPIMKVYPSCFAHQEKSPPGFIPITILPIDWWTFTHHIFSIYPSKNSPSEQ